MKNAAAFYGSLFLASFLATESVADYNQTLQWHENRGGHTIAQGHVGKDLSFLLNRCRTTPGLAEASSWSSLTAGQNIVNSVLSSQRATITNWMQQPNQPRLVIRYWHESNAPNGTHVRCPSTVNSGPRVRVLILQKTTQSPSGWIVLTSYPA